MKRICKHFSGGGNFAARTQLLKGLLSLLLTTTAFTSCTNESEVFKQSSPKLDVKFGVALQQARAIFTDASLPSGSVVGAMLDDGTATDYDSYSPLYFTATGAGDSQTWTPNTDVVLTETKGTLYAYYPHDGNVDISAIPVDMTAADQTDWLYATPVADVNEDKASVAVTMNHAAANINVTINKGTYLGEGNISNITVQSDGIALGGTFNAAQATPGYTAFEDEGEPLSRDLTTTTGAATDIMVVPNGTEAAITFLATIDDIQFTATSAAVTLEKGNSYQYTLNLSDISTYMTIGSFAVTPWSTVTKDNLDLEVYDEFDAGIVATYYVDEASLASRSAGVEVQVLSSYNSFQLSSVDRMKVDGVEVTPSLTYTFTSAGNHTVKYLLKDNTQVPRYMFYNCKALTAYKLPETVTTIGYGAFRECTGMTGELVIPNSVTSIGSETFYNCQNISGNINLPQNCYIGDGAFYNCKGLTGALIIPNVMKSIGNCYGQNTTKKGTFEGCKGLTSVVIPESVTSIGDRAFMGCEGMIGTLNIPETVTSIGRYAFYNCSGLTGQLVIPHNITKIQFKSFDGCSGLTGTLVIPEGITVVEYGAFRNCKGITEISIPESVNTIEGSDYWGGAFQGCTGLTGTFTIPETVTTIGDAIFSGCTGLTEITIPNSVTRIGNYMFSFCI